MENININIKVLRHGAAIPAYQTPGAAACDLCAAIDESVTIAPGQSALIPGGIAIEPEAVRVFEFLERRYVCENPHEPDKGHDKQHRH